VHGATTRRLANRAREVEREEGHAGEGNQRDSLAPLGSERERERGGCGADWHRQAGSAYQGQQTRAAGPGGRVWAELAFFFFLNFLIAFPFLFFRVFN
jgi:hypothetical protein